MSGKVKPLISGAIYTVAFLNDYTFISYVRLPKKKTEFLQTLEMCKKRAEIIRKAPGFVIQKIRLDGAGKTCQVI